MQLCRLFVVYTKMWTVLTIDSIAFVISHSHSEGKAKDKFMIVLIS